jgi:hypothetical protein
MNIIREYLSQLTDHQIYDIIADYESYEKTGCTGDGPLRTHTRTALTDKGIPVGGHITMWMNIMAFESYRKFSILGLKAINPSYGEH